MDKVVSGFNHAVKGATEAFEVGKKTIVSNVETVSVAIRDYKTISDTELVQKIDYFVKADKKIDEVIAKINALRKTLLDTANSTTSISKAFSSSFVSTDPQYQAAQQFAQAAIDATNLFTNLANYSIPSQLSERLTNAKKQIRELEKTQKQVLIAYYHKDSMEQKLQKKIQSATPEKAQALRQAADEAQRQFDEIRPQYLTLAGQTQENYVKIEQECFAVYVQYYIEYINQVEKVFQATTSQPETPYATYEDLVPAKIPGM